MTGPQTMLAKYGEPGPQYEAKYCEVWHIQEDFPWFADVENNATDDPDDVVVKIYCNKVFKAMLFPAFTNLEAAGLHKEIKTYGGCYNIRTVRGRKSTSIHSWAGAIDLNEKIEKLAQLETRWSGQFIAIMKAAGLFWGGDWKSRKDSMHFAMVNG